MKKCKFCNRNISEFSIECPFCHNKLDFDDASNEMLHVSNLEKLKKIFKICGLSLIFIAILLLCIFMLLYKLILGFISYKISTIAIIMCIIGFIFLLIGFLIKNNK